MSFIRKVLLVAAMMALPFGAAAADDSASKIVGGTQSRPGAWPFQVALVRSDVSDNFQAQFCGGTLIKPGFVLTAAHCITDNFGSVVGASSLQALVGTQSLSSGGRRINVTKVLRHPSYNPDTLDFDVAVLKLASNVTGITPVTLISPSQESTLAAVGDLATVVGWGNVLVTEPGSDAQGSFPTNLREVKVPILSRTRCNSANSYQGSLTQRMICAGTFAGGKDSCQGDSGGPLIVANTSGKFNVQAGVVSWGFGCAFRNLPGIYTRLAHPTLNNWVRSKIGG